jgi:uncharacterized protein (TIRG00374 family)
VKGSIWRKVVIAVAIAAVFYFILVILSDINEVTKAAGQFEWVYVLPVLLLVMGNYVLRSERWHQYLHKVELGLPRRRSYWLFLSGLSMSITPVKAGEAVKALLLKLEKGAPVERGIAVVFAERMTDMTGVIVLIGIGSLAVAYGLISFALVIVLVGAILLVLSSKKTSERVVAWLSGRKPLARFGKMLDGALKDARQLLTGKNLVEGTVFGSVAWAAECIAFYLILQGCSIEISILEAVFIYAFSSVVGALSMLPGGMGTTEATMVGLLVLLNVSASSASFAVILTRVCTLWFAVAVGIVFMLAYTGSSTEAKMAVAGGA